jgi:transcriptional regulator with XRE-family HTH domain
MSTAGLAPIRFRFAITTWGTALQKCRVGVDLSYKDVADRVGISKALVKTWERGGGYPTVTQLKRLYGSMSSLRRFENLLPRENQADVEVERAADQGVAPGQSVTEAPPPPPQEIDEPRTFPAALRLTRLLEGLHQHEVADLIGVEQSTVSTWERGDATPIQEHYDRLVDLFEHLRELPRPAGIRDIPKPRGPQGMTFEAPVGATRASTRDTEIRASIPVNRLPPDPVPLPGTTRQTVPERSLTDLEDAGIAYALSLRELHAARRDLDATRTRALELEEEVKRLEKEAAVAETKLHELARGRA